MKSLLCSLTLLGILWLVAHRMGQLSFGQSVQPATSKPPSSSFHRSLDGQTARVRYGWADCNFGPNKAVFLNYETEIDLRKLAAAITAFGIPESWQNERIGYRSPAELAMKLKSRASRIFARGILSLSDRGQGSLDVNHRWMITRSRADLVPVTGDLTRLALSRKYQNEREVIGLMASLVQSMEYKIPESYRPADNGESILTLGINMPLETLYNGWGDCDTKSVLIAALLANLKGAQVIFLRGNGHLFLGIRGTPREGDRYVNIRGVDYILVEATHAWPLGRIPDELWNGVARNQFQIIPLY